MSQSTNTSGAPVCFLFDNGSLRPASTLSLRTVARAFELEVGAPVQAVSLLHSSAVAPESLEREPARLLEPALQTWLAENPRGVAVVLPFFFGPSAALTEYVPPRLQALAEKFPEARLELASWLIDLEKEDTRIAEALAANVRATMHAERLTRPHVVLVDHGSPQRAVAAVRDFLGAQLRAILGGEIADFGVASMERRPGEAYAFNDPLLAAILRTPPFAGGEVIVALQFLSPGRHAGPEGDVAQICAEARAECPQLRTWMTGTLGADPRVIAVLAERYRKAAARLAAGARG